MKIGDKVKLNPRHQNDVLADTHSNLIEGDISSTRASQIERLVENDSVFIVNSIEENCCELRPEGKSWCIYGLHEPEDLILIK